MRSVVELLDRTSTREEPPRFSCPVRVSAAVSRVLTENGIDRPPLRVIQAAARTAWLVSHFPDTSKPLDFDFTVEESETAALWLALRLSAEGWSPPRLVIDLAPALTLSREAA